MESIRGDQGARDEARDLQTTQETPAVPAAPGLPGWPGAQGPPGAGADVTGPGPGVVAAAGRPPWRRRRTIVLALAVLLAAGAGIGAWLATSGSTPPARSGFVVVTRIVRATTGTMSSTVSTSGTIQPAQTASLNFAVSGRVTAVDVAVGDMVTAGQTVATIAPTALEAQEAAAQSSLSSDQAKLAADQASDAGTSQITADEAAIASAQTQLTTAKKSVAEADLVSTITGEVSNVDLTVGEQVSGAGAGGSSSSPTHLYGPGAGTSSSTGQVTVVSPDRFIVNCTVDDTEVGELAVGDHVVVVQTGTPVAAPGTITFLGLVPSGTGIPSYPVTVTLTGTPSGVYAGTNAQVSVVVKSQSHVLEVPTPAVVYERGHPSVVEVLAGGERVTRRVTVGTTANGKTQITGGLTSGQRVLERLETFHGHSTGRKGTAPLPFGGRTITGAGTFRVNVSGG